MTWDKSHRDAMADAARQDIPPKEADKMWTKYTELGMAVRDGSMSNAAALKAFVAFCQGLASRPGTPTGSDTR